MGNKKTYIFLSSMIISGVLLVVLTLIDIRLYNEIYKRNEIIKNTRLNNPSNKITYKFGYKDIMDNLKENEEINIISISKDKNNSYINTKFSYSLDEVSIKENINKIRKWNNIKALNNIIINFEDNNKCRLIMDVNFIINQ